ncbi:MAG: dTDP-4-dehydrorhamnose reductase [Solirubrobacterales bacterium]
MKILVTGADGMLGRDLVEVSLAAGHEVRGLGRTDLDVTDPDRVRDRLEIDRPDVVINCAAWTDVDGAEDDPEGADLVNGEGAANVAQAAASVDARVLYVSTDYVFDGTKGEPYLESDPPVPISAYGRSKLKGEEATLFANPRAFVVRTTWLFGAGGPNFVETMLRAGETEGKVLVVHDQVGCPTWTTHLSVGLVRLLDTDRFGIHHMAATGHCSWYDFAREIFDRAAMEVVTLSATTEMLGRKAPRPAFSALESEYEDAIELPPWQEGLAGYLAARPDEGPGGSR